MLVTSVNREWKPDSLPPFLPRVAIALDTTN